MVERNKDGCYHGLCDLCGRTIDDDDIRDFTSRYRWEITVISQDCGWRDIGDHLVCPTCLLKVKDGEMKIEIKEIK